VNNNFIRKTSAALSLASAPEHAKDAAEFLLSASPIDELIHYLDYNCLTPLCFENYATLPSDEQMPDLLSRLRASTITQILISQSHQAAIQDTHKALSAAGIPYVFIKGVASRLLLYRDPQLRPAADIDLLIHPQHLDAAIDALEQAGLENTPHNENETHETVLMHGHTEVDLHWHLLRPGRLSDDIEKDFLQKAISSHGLSVPDPESSLVIQLVHPAYTKYVNSPWAKDIRIIDFLYLIEQFEVDWQALADRLSAYKACTAAWCTLTWFLAVSNAQVPASFMQRIAPSRSRQRYLKKWILGGLTQRFYQRRNLMRIAFTLAIQDRYSDSLTATLRYLVDQARLSHPKK